MAALRVTILVAALLLATCYPASIPNNFELRLTDDVVLAPKKRPFCNTFAGCGRKRSLAPPAALPDMMRARQYEDDAGYDSDNAVEELSRRVLSEAKLWEALQEAGAQVARRKQKEASM